MKPSLPLYALTALSLMTPTWAAGKIHLEAENGQLQGTEISRERPGYSGTGYVTGIDGDNDGISWIIKDAAPGIYDVFIRYAVDEEKGYGLNVNGASVSGIFAPVPNGFGTQAAGKVELKAGTNRIAIERGWGYYDVDYIELVPATASAPLLKPPAAPVDLKADARTRALKKFLVDNYGRHTLSGQYDAPENKFVHDLTGKTPALFGSDLIDYSPSRLAHGSDPKPTTEEMIRTVQSGQILTLSWHWNAPSHLIDGKYQKDGKTVDAPW
jgi:mannan endo-1,4-beta-mannosidase